MRAYFGWQKLYRRESLMCNDDRCPMMGSHRAKEGGGILPSEHPPCEAEHTIKSQQHYTQQDACYQVGTLKFALQITEEVSEPDDSPKVESMHILS